jgi:hypothetical protein
MHEISSLDVIEKEQFGSYMVELTGHSEMRLAERQLIAYSQADFCEQAA